MSEKAFGRAAQAPLLFRADRLPRVAEPTPLRIFTSLEVAMLFGPTAVGARWRTTI